MSITIRLTEKQIALAQHIIHAHSVVSYMMLDSEIDVKKAFEDSYPDKWSKSKFRKWARNNIFNARAPAWGTEDHSTYMSYLNIMRNNKKLGDDVLSSIEYMKNNLNMNNIGNYVINMTFLKSDLED